MNNEDINITNKFSNQSENNITIDTKVNDSYINFQKIRLSEINYNSGRFLYLKKKFSEFTNYNENNDENKKTIKDFFDTLVEFDPKKIDSLILSLKRLEVLNPEEAKEKYLKIFETPLEIPLVEKELKSRFGDLGWKYYSVKAKQNIGILGLQGLAFSYSVIPQENLTYFSGTEWAILFGMSCLAVSEVRTIKDIIATRFKIRNKELAYFNNYTEDMIEYYNNIHNKDFLEKNKEYIKKLEDVSRFLENGQFNDSFKKLNEYEKVTYLDSMTKIYTSLGFYQKRFLEKLSLVDLINFTERAVTKINMELEKEGFPPVTIHDLNLQGDKGIHANQKLFSKMLVDTISFEEEFGKKLIKSVKDGEQESLDRFHEPLNVFVNKVKHVKLGFLFTELFNTSVVEENFVKPLLELNTILKKLDHGWTGIGIKTINALGEGLKTYHDAGIAAGSDDTFNLVATISKIAGKKLSEIEVIQHIQDTLTPTALTNLKAELLSKTTDPSTIEKINDIFGKLSSEELLTKTCESLLSHEQKILLESKRQYQELIDSEPLLLSEKLKAKVLYVKNYYLEKTLNKEDMSIYNPLKYLFTALSFSLSCIQKISKIADEALPMLLVKTTGTVASTHLFLNSKEMKEIKSINNSSFNDLKDTKFTTVQSMYLSVFKDSKKSDIKDVISDLIDGMTENNKIKEKTKSIIERDKVLFKIEKIKEKENNKNIDDEDNKRSKPT